MKFEEFITSAVTAVRINLQGFLTIDFTKKSNNGTYKKQFNDIIISPNML